MCLWKLNVNGHELNLNLELTEWENLINFQDAIVPFQLTIHRQFKIRQTNLHYEIGTHYLWVLDSQCQREQIIYKKSFSYLHCLLWTKLQQLSTIYHSKKNKGWNGKVQHVHLCNIVNVGSESWVEKKFCCYWIPLSLKLLLSGLICFSFKQKGNTKVSLCFQNKSYDFTGSVNISFNTKPQSCFQMSKWNIADW